SIRNWRSEYLRRNSSASALDSARLLVKALSDSCAIDNCLRNSVSAATGSAFADCVTVPLLDSDKELFPCAYAQNPIASCKLQITRNSSILTPRRFRFASCDSRPAFFFSLFLSRIERSLGLCLLRVLKPFAHCPHGLTG